MKSSLSETGHGGPIDGAFEPILRRPADKH
jgi:hypothetical protein